MYGLNIFLLFIEEVYFLGNEYNKNINSLEIFNSNLFDLTFQTICCGYRYEEKNQNIYFYSFSEPFEIRVWGYENRP